MTTQDLEAGGPPPQIGIDAAPRAVTAFFDTSEMAVRAEQDLIAAGVPAAAVRVAGGQALASEPAHPHGFWETLKDFFMPDEDRHMYAEGLRRGGFALSVETDSAAYAHVLDLLDRDGAVDMEERAASWRDEGWPDVAGAGAGERAFTPPGNATAGFGASMADQPLFNPPLTTGEMEPGLVEDVAEGRMEANLGTPDSAYAAAAPGLGDTSGQRTAAAGDVGEGPGTTMGSAPPEAIRDLSHGRSRVRSYLAGERPPSEFGL